MIISFCILIAKHTLSDCWLDYLWAPTWDRPNSCRASPITGPVFALVRIETPIIFMQDIICFMGWFFPFPPLNPSIIGRRFRWWRPLPSLLLLRSPPFITVNSVIFIPPQALHPSPPPSFPSSASPMPTLTAAALPFSSSPPPPVWIFFFPHHSLHELLNRLIRTYLLERFVAWRRC